MTQVQDRRNVSSPKRRLEYHTILREQATVEEVEKAVEVPRVEVVEKVEESPGEVPRVRACEEREKLRESPEAPAPAPVG